MGDLRAAAEHDAGVLDAAVGIEQLGARGAHLGARHEGDQLAEPPGLDHLGVVVEQEQDLAASLLRRPIVQRREVEGTGLGQHPHPGVLRQPLEQGERLGPLTTVVDDQEFDGSVIGPGEHAIGAARQEVGAVARGHDDRDEGLGFRRRPLDPAPLRRQRRRRHPRGDLAALRQMLTRELPGEVGVPAVRARGPMAGDGGNVHDPGRVAGRDHPQRERIEDELQAVADARKAAQAADEVGSIGGKTADGIPGQD